MKLVYIANSNTYRFGSKGKYLLVRLNEDNSTYRVPDPFAAHFSKKWCGMFDKVKAERMQFPIKLKNDIGHLDVPVEIGDKFVLGAAKFAVNWIVFGGMDPIGVDPQKYPKGDKRGLEELKLIVEDLGIAFLINREDEDLKAVREPSREEHVAVLPAVATKKARKVLHCNNCLKPGYVVIILYSWASVDLCICRHLSSNCLLQFNNVADKMLSMYTPQKTQSSKSVVESDTVVTAAARGSEPASDSDETVPIITILEEKAKVAKGRNVYVAVHDQDSIPWRVPPRPFDLTVVPTIGEDGRVRISVSAPLEFSAYPHADFKKRAMEVNGELPGWVAIGKPKAENKRLTRRESARRPSCQRLWY